MAFASVLKIVNSILSGVATVTAVSVMAFSGYMLYEDNYIQNKAYGMQSIDYKPIVTEDSVSVDELLDNIPDARGWITMDGTHIDYPVVQGPDDLYYVNRDEYGNPSLSGSIYLQAKNQPDFSDSYNLLYGHHMDNGAMFGDLTNFIDAEYFNSHLTGTLVTLKEAYSIDVVSLVRTDAYEKALYDRTSLDWDEYESEILQNENIEVIRTNPAITSAEKFIVLSTCEGVSTDGRILLICRLVSTGKQVDPTPTPKPGDPTPTPKPDQKGTAPIVKTGDPRNDGMGWALLNLCCLILTATTILPYVFESGGKKKKQTKMKNYIGPFANVILAIVAAYVFFTYENMKLPMIMKDRYTPWMLIILGVALASEEICSRRKKKDKNVEKEEEKVDV